MYDNMTLDNSDESWSVAKQSTKTNFNAILLRRFNL